MADKELQAALARISTLQAQVDGLASQVSALSAQARANGDALAVQAQITSSAVSVRVAADNQGRYYVAGMGIGLQGPVKAKLKLGADLEEDVRRVLRAAIKPGGILNPA